MKATTKNSLRRIRHQLGSFIGVMIIVGVAIGFYGVLKSTSGTYTSVGEQYFAENKLPSAILYANDITAGDEAKVGNIAGVVAAQRRATVDAKRGDDTLRVESYDVQNPRVNTPYVYEGQAPRSADECLLLERYARINDVKLGDRVTITTNTFTDSCKVSGFGTAPERAYLSKNAATPIADPSEFGILFVDTAFAERNNIPFSQLAVLLDDDTKLDQVERTLGTERVYRSTKRADIYSYDAFRSDVAQFELFAYIFPAIFLVISAVVVYVSQRRNVLRDRRQIGILKAMGLSNAQVLRQYLLYAITIVLGGIVIGITLSLLAGPMLINQFKVMLDVPRFGFALSSLDFVLPTIIACIISLLATYIAVRSVVRIHPAEAMHAEPPASGRDIWLQRTPVWRWLSFNTRYSLKAALRNRGRFVAMVVGMIATTALLTFSLGFRDSFMNVTSSYFTDVAVYDLRVSLEMKPLSDEPAWLARDAKSSDKVMSIPGKLAANDHTEDLALFISDNPFAMHHLTNAEGKQPVVGDGVVLPKFYADRLGVTTGDEIRVYTQDNSLDGHVKVTGLTEQMMGFNAIITYETAKRIGLEAPMFNTVLLTSDRDVKELKKEIERQPNVMSASSRVDEQASIDKFTSIFMLYIVILVGFSVLLGVATLYSISAISLLSRQYEFILLRVMGYSRGDILRAYAKELLLQAVIAVPIGAVLGYIIVLNAADAFATDSIAFRGSINWPTYLIVAAILLLVLLYVLLIAARGLHRQNLPEGLKSREE